MHVNAVNFKMHTNKMSAYKQHIYAVNCFQNAYKQNECIIIAYICCQLLSKCIQAK